MLSDTDSEHRSESSVCPPVTQYVVLPPPCPSCPVSTCLEVLACRDTCWAAPSHCMFLFLPGAKQAQGRGSQSSDTKYQAGLRWNLYEIAVLLFCEGNAFPVLDWAPRRTELMEKKWNSFTSSSVLQKPLDSEWYRHCSLADVKNNFESKEESSIAVTWFWRNMFSAFLDVENSLKNPSRLIFSCLVDLAQKLRSGN